MGTVLVPRCNQWKVWGDKIFEGELVFADSLEEVGGDVYVCKNCMFVFQSNSPQAISCLRCESTNTVFSKADFIHFY